MNDQPTPQSPQVDSTDPSKNAPGASIQTPSPENVSFGQPANPGTSTTEAPVPVENMNNPVAPVSPVESAPVNNPVTSSPMPEIPVTDNTVPVSEPVQEAQANDPLAQTQPVNPFTATADQTAPTQQPSPVVQVPAQPQGFMAKLLSIFKK